MERHLVEGKDQLNKSHGKSRKANWDGGNINIEFLKDFRFT